MERFNAVADMTFLLLLATLMLLVMFVNNRRIHAMQFKTPRGDEYLPRTLNVPAIRGRQSPIEDVAYMSVDDAADGSEGGDFQ